jgi:amino acid permease
LNRQNQVPKLVYHQRGGSNDPMLNIFNVFKSFQTDMAEMEKKTVLGSAASASESNGVGDFITVLPDEQGDEYGKNAAPGESVVPKGQLKRTFTTRHIQMIALGANIGSGVYISSGKVNIP